jgi:LacI family transcriptional regulator
VARSLPPRGEPRPAAGLRDVARAAGVSVASASVALNGRAGVADPTRARILAAAQQLGYRANPQARALRRGRTDTYAFVVRNFANPFFLDVISGAEEVAAQHGATLVVADSHYSLVREAEQVRSMAARHCAGLAIAPVGSGESVRLWQSLRPGMPVVALNAAVPGLDGVSRVAPENRAAVRLPLERLAELGHTRVAFLTAPRPLMADPDRLRHFRRAARALGVSGVVVPAPLTMADVHESVLRLLRDDDPPTAIVANSDWTAHGVYTAARSLGVPVGTVLSVVGHDDLPTSALLDPPLATIRLDRRAMGRVLMERLLEPGPARDHTEPVSLVERASLGPPGRLPVQRRSRARHPRSGTRSPTPATTR